jgi:hypothetical protein
VAAIFVLFLREAPMRSAAELEASSKASPEPSAG